MTKHSKTDRERALALPTKERARHDPVVVEDIWEAEQRLGRRARAQNALQLDMLRRRKRGTGFALDDRQHMTGLKIHCLFGRAGLRARTIASYSEFISRGRLEDFQGSRLSAYKGLRKAMILADIGREEVWRVCCMNEAVGGEPSMEILRRTLDKLADHEREWWDGREDTAIA